MKIQFIWGPGGVGKSHLSILQAYQSTYASTALFTLDPSRRLFDLLQISREKTRVDVKLKNKKFFLCGLEATQLFEELSQKSIANAKVRIFYEQMVKGLQEFREYLSLIQLSDEINKSTYERLVIDTPPLQEAFGLQRAMNNLQSFFSQSLIQFALKGQQAKILHSTMKHAFELSRVFIGKKSAERVFEFLEWLGTHADRFQKAADQLTKLSYSEETEHLFVLSPETAFVRLEDIQKLSKPFKNISFVINRSVFDEKIPDENDSFCNEMREFKNLESKLIQDLKRLFPKSEISRLPYQLMGDDTEEELIRFSESRMTKVDVPKST
ncbi:MAG: hypothetical protein J0L93_08635 [Deltaproteobacteria bacterium]|nr:hypothetical protein [Deltaproteobacteria bacterium]